MGLEVAGRRQLAWGRETSSYKGTEQVSKCTEDNGSRISLLWMVRRNIEMGRLERQKETWSVRLEMDASV